MIPRILHYMPYNKKLYSWLWKVYSRSQKLEAAVFLIQRGVNYAPNDMDLRWWLSLTLLKQGNYQEALNHFEFMLAHWPESQKDPEGGWFAQIHALMGRCYLALGNTIDAAKELNTAHGIAPWDLDACKTMVDLYYCTDRFDEIPEMLDQYIRKYPQLYPPYIWKAYYIHNKLYDPEVAVLWYEQANSKLTKDIIKYCERYDSSANMLGVFIDHYARALVQSGKDDMAWQLVQSQKNQPVITPITFQELVFDFFLDTKNYQEAERAALRSIQTNPKMPIFWAYLAQSQAKQNKFEEANKNIKHALALSNEFLMIYEILAEIQIRQKIWTSAIETCRKLVTYAPSASDWVEWLAYCYSGAGELDKAREYYERTVSMDPYDAIAWANLGEVYSRLGQNDLAISACERSLSFNRLTDNEREQTLKILELSRAKK